MGFEFIQRIIKTTLLVATIVALFVAVYYSVPYAVGLWFGTIWGSINFYFIKILIQEVSTPSRSARRNVVLLILTVKFPLLYFAGYILLRWQYIPDLSLLLGFSLLFVVMVLKALGRVLLQLDSPRLRRTTTGVKQ